MFFLYSTLSAVQISLKGNQSSLHDDVKEFFSRDDKKFFEKFGVDEFTFRIEKDHGRTEKRDYKLCTSLGWLARNGHSPQNLAVLRKIALNLFKTAPNPTGKPSFSLHKKQITCMCDDVYLKTMLQML
jgi:hypothetical protein